MVNQNERLELLMERAVALLRSGGIVAAPTDTQYALAALTGQGGAIMHLFALKGRSDEQALPIFLPDLSWLEIVAGEVTVAARALAEEVWPGALTLVLQRNVKWRSLAVPGKTVAVRIPNHPVALALLAAVAEPITGTSANRHGEVAAVEPEAVGATFGEAVEVLPPLGVMPDGRASTILDCTGSEPHVLRAGAVSEERIRDVLARHVALSNRN